MNWQYLNLWFPVHGTIITFHDPGMLQKLFNRYSCIRICLQCVMYMYEKLFSIINILTWSSCAMISTLSKLNQSGTSYSPFWKCKHFSYPFIFWRCHIKFWYFKSIEQSLTRSFNSWLSVMNIQKHVDICSHIKLLTSCTNIVSYYYMPIRAVIHLWAYDCCI